METQEYQNQEFWTIYLRIKKLHPNYSRVKLMTTTRYAFDKKYRTGKYTRHK